MKNSHETDVLIIGAGIAGGITAILLAEAGVKVTLANGSDVLESSNTYYAQGGIIFKNPSENPADLYKDIIKAGAGLSQENAVNLLISQGPKLVEELLIDKLQVMFDSENGSYLLASEGGHSFPRVIHAADATGRAIQDAINQKLLQYSNIKLLAGFTAIDLLTPEHHSKDRLEIYNKQRCVGSYLFNQAERNVLKCIAKKVVLATGGIGQIFLQTTNPKKARGDGIAMAYRAGARVINMEFVQFHPTKLYHKNMPSFLISEAVRGAGAKLKNTSGEYFMERYSADWKDLAPRDVVSRAIHHEMLREDSSNVYLDFHSFIAADEIREKFPTIYSTCLENGIDITRESVPVVPAAHYSCGGVWVDDCSRSSIRNLYAVGEVSCTGVHGANRLASTSLLEALVWSKRAFTDIVENIKETENYDSQLIPDWQDTGQFEPDPALIAQDMATIRHIMWNYVGLIRNGHRLQRAIRELRNLEVEIDRFYRRTKISDELIGLRNVVRTSIIIATAASENRQSRGNHFRED